jgi:hypothetical protein
VLLQLRGRGDATGVGSTLALAAAPADTQGGNANELSSESSSARQAVGLAVLDMLATLPISAVIESGPISPGPYTSPSGPPVSILILITIPLPCAEWMFALFSGTQSALVVTHALRLLCGLAQASIAWLAQFRLAGGYLHHSSICVLSIWALPNASHNTRFEPLAIVLRPFARNGELYMYLLSLLLDRPCAGLPPVPDQRLDHVSLFSVFSVPLTSLVNEMRLGKRLTNWWLHSHQNNSWAAGRLCM